MRKRLNRFQIGCMVYRQFSMSFAFKSTCGQWCRCTENWRKTGHPLSTNSNNILSSILSQISCGLSSLIEYHFFSEPGSMNDHGPFSKSSCIQRYDFSICQTFFFIVFSSTRNVVEHRHEYDPPAKFSGVSPNLNIKLLTSSLRGNELYPGKFSTRVPLARRRICQSFRHFEKISTIPIFVPMHRSIEGFRESSQDITQIPKSIFMNDSPNQLFPILKSHLAQTPFS